MRAALIALGLLLALTWTAGGETLCVYTEEQLDGEGVAHPLPSMEGLLDALFDSDHVVFEPGATGLSLDWEKRSFNSVRRLAREGGAELLLVARFISVRSARDPSRVEIRADYVLLRVATSQPLASGQLTMDNSGQEDVGFRDLAFRMGRELGLQIIRCCP